MTTTDVFRDKVAWWCIFGGVTLFVYLLRRFFRGREQVKRNCDLIGKQLEHLQRVIEENERKEKEQQAKEGAEAVDSVTESDDAVDKKDK